MFPLFHGGQGTPHLLDEAQEHLSDQLVAWWTNFARTGNPNAGSAAKPYWQKYTSTDDDVFVITQKSSHMATDYGAQTYPHNMKNDCTLWDRINQYQ